MGIVAISMGDNFLMGLKADGAVVTTDKNKGKFSSWTDILGIASGKIQGIGLRSDGTVVMAGAESYYSEHEFKKWKDMMTPDALIHCSIIE